MSGAHEAFKINLNQNLWGLLVSLAALGAAERYQLDSLYWIALGLSVVMAASMAVTTLAYTINYWKNKNKN